MKIVVPPTKIRKKMSKVITIQLQKSKFKKGNKEKRILKKGKKKRRDGGKWITGTGKGEGEAKKNKAK